MVCWVCIGLLSNTSPNTSQYPILDRAGWSVAQKVWQTSGAIATAVTGPRGSRDLWKMWQTSGSGRLVTQNRGKLVAVAD